MNGLAFGTGGLTIGVLHSIIIEVLIFVKMLVDTYPGCLAGTSRDGWNSFTSRNLACIAAMISSAFCCWRVVCFSISGAYSSAMV